MISYIFEVYASVNSYFHDTIYVCIKVLGGKADKLSMKKGELTKMEAVTTNTLTKTYNSGIIIHIIRLMLYGMVE